MSRKGRDRLKVLQEVQKEHLTQKATRLQLELTERWVRKLLQQLRAEGDGGVIHRWRGQPQPLRKF